MIPGVIVSMGGKDWRIPPLTLGQLKRLGPAIERIVIDPDTGMREASIVAVVEIVTAALSRNYPEITTTEVEEELLDLGNASAVLRVVLTGATFTASSPLRPGNIISAIPWPWNEVLSRMQVVWPSAVIAGGALRDLDHGRGIKDVDVFVPAVALSEVERLFPDAKKIELEGASVFGSDVPYHYTFVRYGWLFEVTFKDDIENLLDMMDVGLCMIKYDGRIVTSSREYVRDSVRKTLTLLRLTGADVENHIARIFLKYPDFRCKNALEDCIQTFDVKMP